jgi:hypothetical protein
MNTNDINTNNNSSFLPTNASCAYFLRSILATHHDRTPWLLQEHKQQHDNEVLVKTNPNVDNNINSYNNNYNNDNDCDCVFILFTAQLEEEKSSSSSSSFIRKENSLIKFRVSDVCPSWYLYSVITLDLNNHYYNNNNQDDHNNTSYSIMMKKLFLNIMSTSIPHNNHNNHIVEMFIYHKFPYNRQRLSSIHMIIIMDMKGLY